jgi:DNA-binding NtrC family response regulator
VAQEIRRWDRWLPLILITATSSEELAIAALKAGINDYFKPPFVFDELLASVKRCLADALPQQAAARRTPRVSHLVNGQQMVGESPPMQEIKAYLRKVAATDSTVMITGESGTGKELAADLVHRNSARHQRPFVCINCAALPDSLIESELFGYEKGAFTGANARKEGQLKLADGGTVFLDEIGDMSPYAQAKILRALESREIQRLGARRSIPLNVRVIAATNHDLERVVEEDKFRKDLYFRLNVARIHLPPLRDRKEDLPLLLNHYVRELNFRFGLAVEGFTAEAFSCLLRYDWPGNIRELKNLLEVSFMNHPCRKIALLDLPEPFRRHFRDAAGLSQDERERMLSALFATHWNMSKAAQKLHWSRMTLYRKMTKYQIVRGGEVGQAVSQLTLSHLPGDVTEV